MNSVQESILSFLRERDARRHLAFVVCMIAVATALAVFWSLHLNGITLSSGDLICGLEEHMHTADCYAWVAETDGTEEIEITESTEATEIIEGTESAIRAESTETASTETVSESTGSTESIIDAAAGTESVIEIATESATEALTEEETESPQPGDTKVVNGVTYVYTLICGMEEHTHTDACYESESSEEDSTAEEISGTESAEEGNAAVTAGISGLFYDTRVYLGSAASGSEPAVASLLASAGTGDTYYFADSTTLASAAANQDDSYIVYTMLENSSAASGYDYYVVSADDTLVYCTYLGDASASSNKYDVDANLVKDTADEGMYCWINSSGDLCFKCTTSSSDDVFDDYRWTLSGTATDSTTGSGTYTIYNSENSVYIAPQDLGVSETLEGKGWWTNNTNEYPGTCDYSEDYTLSANTLVIFEVECTGSVSYTNNTGTYSNVFNVELFSTDSEIYFTTETDDQAWGDLNITKVYSAGAFYPTEDDTYTIMVERSTSTAGGTETSVYTITYLDSSGTMLASYSATSVSTDKSNIVGNNVYTRVISQFGYYDVSVIYAVSKEYAKTENADQTDDTGETMDFTSLSAISTDKDYRMNEMTLKGDFDITYTFYHKGNNSTRGDTSSAGKDQNYVLAISDKTDSYVYIKPSYEYIVSGASVTVSESGDEPTSWLDFSSKMNAGYGSSNSYTMCKVNVVRKNNAITVTTGIYRNTTTSPSYTYTVILSYESISEITLYITGINCEVQELTVADNSTDYDITDYDAYGAVGIYNTTLTLSASSYSISAAATSMFRKSVEFTADNTSAASFAESGGTNEVFYLARVRGYTAWFDGTNGGMATNSSTDTALFTTADASGETFTVTAPTATNGNSLGYTLRGWYDIYNNKYYEEGDTITLTGNTVLYADWEIDDYNIGQDNDYTVSTVSTGNFMDIEMFDFNELFNIYSVALTDSITASETANDGTEYFNTFTTSLSSGSHSEAFYNATSGTALSQLNTLNFLFFRNEYYQYYYDTSNSVGIRAPRIDYPANRSSQNTSGTAATPEILGSLLTEEDEVTNDLLTILFDTDNTVDTVTGDDTPIYGKTYVGSADYLFQYDSATGYYYYDSSLNAAAYNQSEKRFYVYDYLTAVSSGTSTSDFMPYNYLAYSNSYTYNTSNKLNTSYMNYWFGMSTEISFYLSDTVASGNNKGIDRYNTTFKFSGDDDVWVFIDGYLVLDLGGVHGMVYGEIDFTTGEVVVVNDYTHMTNSRGIIDYTAGAGTSQTDAETYIRSLDAGTHTLTFYYLERGAGESNAALYSNISPVYTLKLAKAITSGSSLSYAKNVTFKVYDSDSFSSDDYVGEATTDSDGVLTIDGLLPNVTYYLVETEAPEDYPLSHKYLTVYVNSDGTAVITVYSSDGSVVETLTCDITDNAYTYDTDEKISDILSSDNYKVFNMTTDTIDDDDEGVVKLLSRVTAGDSNYYLANQLSVFSAQNEIYGAYKIVTLTYVNYKEYELASTGGTGITRCKQAGITIVLVSITGLLIIAFYHIAWLRKLRAIVYKKEYTKEEKRGRSALPGCGAIRENGASPVVTPETGRKGMEPLLRTAPWKGVVVPDPEGDRRR